MATYRSILEGSAPGTLFWKLDGTGPEFFRGGGGKAAARPFASKNVPWLKLDYENLDFSAGRFENVDFFRWETPAGVLEAKRQDNHMIEYPVKAAGDIPAWRFVQENILYSRNPRFSPEEAENSWRMSFKWSPLQELIQFETGVENFYYFLADAPGEMEALMDTMHRKNLEALKIGFEVCSGASVFHLSENTTASVLSPSIYRGITLPHLRDYGKTARGRGMKFIVHMCGKLAGLFDCFAEAGMDGIHAVTPPPVGDTFYMDAREYFGDRFVIIGRFNAQLWKGKTSGEILQVLQGLVPEKLVRTPFALWVTADGTAPSREDILNLTEAFENYNRRIKP